MRKGFLYLIIASCLIGSCRNREGKPGEAETEGRVPVTVTHPVSGILTEAVDLNATSVFLLKTTVKSTATGYLEKVNTQLGEKVSKGKELFVIRSKEAANLGTTISLPDTSFRFSGLISITSPGSGYITQLTYQAGDYVQDGETLAAISDANSLVFMLELPYELRTYLPLNKTVRLTLPDGQMQTGTIFKSMPMVDPVSQTQNYIVRISGNSAIPENLVAKVEFVKNQKSSAVSLPKEAIVTNETQSEFWIVKMSDSITAIKMPVVKGIETSGRIEILSPVLNPGDIILLTGNYGLPDTAKVSIINGQE
jgi:multidrug efflux pump subunit AcrA (membrane-fusion protein)